MIRCMISLYLSSCLYHCRVYRGRNGTREDMTRRYGHLSGLLDRGTRRQEAWRAYIHARERARARVCRCRWQIASLAGSARRTCEKLPRGTQPVPPRTPGPRLLYYTSRSLRTRRESYANLETGSPGIFLRAVGYACAIDPSKVFGRAT